MDDVTTAGARLAGRIIEGRVSHEAFATRLNRRCAGWDMDRAALLAQVEGIVRPRGVPRLSRGCGGRTIWTCSPRYRATCPATGTSACGNCA